jgi:hypothetical protein
MDKPFRLSENKVVLTLELCIVALVIAVTTAILTICWWARYLVQQAVKPIRD